MTSPVSPINTAKAVRQLIGQIKNPVQRGLTSLVLRDEVGGSNMHYRFAQHVASVWAPKMLTSRSWAERAELSFLEFIEGGFFYYSMPLLGQHVFKKAFSKISPKGFDPKLITKSLGELVKHHPQALKTVLPVKAAIILASLAAITGEYSLSFAKNLFTEKAFGKTSFSDVVSLSDNKTTHKGRKEVVEKAHRRIKQCLVAAAAIGLGAVGLARFGANSAALQKVSKGLVKYADFSFKNGKFDLGDYQNLAVIWFGVASYLDAARDRLEFKEILTRVACVVAPYLSVGKQALAGATRQVVANQFPNSSVLNNKKEVKSLAKIAEESIAKATTQLAQAGKPVSEKAVLETAGKWFSQGAAAKSHIYAWPFLAGVGIVGIVTSLISNHWTKVRFEQAAGLAPKNTASPFISSQRHLTQPLYAQPKPFSPTGYYAEPEAQQA